MHMFARSSRIIITCNKRLTPYLTKEVTALGFQPGHVFQTGLVLEGTLKDCIRLNLNIRSASQVLYSIRQFKATGPEDLYRQLSLVPWEEILEEEGYLSVTSNVDHPTI